MSLDYLCAKSVKDLFIDSFVTEPATCTNLLSSRQPFP